MCRHQLHIYAKCGHSASTLAICDVNSFLRFRCCPDPRGWRRNFEKTNDFCLGCQSTLWQTDLCYDEALSFVKTLVDRPMPFSYVSYGHLPRNNRDCAERLMLEPMMVLGPGGFSAQQSEELKSLLPTAAWKRQQPITTSQQGDQPENQQQVISVQRSCPDLSPGRPVPVRTKSKKRVQFIEDTHVQYFWKDLRPVSVSSHSTGMHMYCAKEPVVWD